jgi:hypothetical protein
MKVMNYGVGIEYVNRWAWRHFRTCSVYLLSILTTQRIRTRKFFTLLTKRRYQYFRWPCIFDFPDRRYYEDGCYRHGPQESPLQIIIRIDVRRVWWPKPPYSKSVKLALEIIRSWNWVFKMSRTEFILCAQVPSCLKKLIEITNHSLQKWNILYTWSVP